MRIRTSPSALACLSPSSSSPRSPRNDPKGKKQLQKAQRPKRSRTQQNGAEQNGKAQNEPSPSHASFFMCTAASMLAGEFRFGSTSIEITSPRRPKHLAQKGEAQKLPWKGLSNLLPKFKPNTKTQKDHPSVANFARCSHVMSAHST